MPLSGRVIANGCDFFFAAVCNSLFFDHYSLLGEIEGNLSGTGNSLPEHVLGDEGAGEFTLFSEAAPTPDGASPHYGQT